VLLLISTLLLFGCAQNGTQTETSAEAIISTSAPIETEPVETTDPNFTCDIKGLDLAGETISIYATGHQSTTDEFYTKEIEGNIVNDAVYKRNLQVENDLNVKLNITLSTSNGESFVPNEISNLVKSGDPAYDLCTMGGYTQTPFVLEGDFYNMREVENLNLGKFYWTQGYNSTIGTSEQQYTATGMFSLSMIRNLYVTLYSKDIFNDRKLPDLYELTVNGEWTIEKLLEIIKDSYKDLNGNNVRDSADFYGFVGGTYTSADPFWTGFGISFLSVDNNDDFVFSLDPDRLINACELVQKLLVGNPDTFDLNSISEDTVLSTVRTDMFAEEQCAMVEVRLGEIEQKLSATEYKGDYGIAPFPKLSKDQEQYYGYVQDQLSVIAIVNTVADDRIDAVGATLEKLCAESYDKVFPAFYETALSYRYMNNIESKKMLDLIYNSIQIDSVYMYNSMFSWTGKMRDMAGATSTPASAIKSYSSAYSIVTEGFNYTFKKLLK